MSKSLVGPVVSAGGDPFWSERLERDPGRRMERVQGGAAPKAVLARVALDAYGSSCRRPFERWSVTPRVTLEELRTALAARHLRQVTARCGASFTATRSRANKTARHPRGLASKVGARLKERGAFREAPRALVREGICGRSRSVG